MVWNSVGIVRSFNSEDESSVDVEFHDTSVHHPIHLGNSNGYTMADLSVEAVLLATEADEADGTAVPSKLTCHNFAGSGLSKEWSIDMPDKEDIMAICCGIGWVSHEIADFQLFDYLLIAVCLLFFSFLNISGCGSYGSP